MSDSGSKTRVEALMEEARSGRGAGELIDARLRISRLRSGWGKLVGVFAREPAGGSAEKSPPAARYSFAIAVSLADPMMVTVMRRSLSWSNIQHSAARSAVTNSS